MVSKIFERAVLAPRLKTIAKTLTPNEFPVKPQQG